MFRLLGLSKRPKGPTEVSTEAAVPLDREELDQLMAQEIVAEMQKQNSESKMEDFYKRKEAQEKAVKEYLRQKKLREQFWKETPAARSEASKRIDEALAKLK